MELTVRPARRQDLDGVCALYRAAVGTEFSVWDENYPSREEACHDFETGNLFVLTENGSLIGALSVVPENEMDAQPFWQERNGSVRELARIVVAEGHHGRGLGGKMVTAVTALLKDRGCRGIHLAVADGNLPALRTYQKIGFQKVGEADMFEGHYFLMEKIL